MSNVWMDVIDGADRVSADIDAMERLMVRLDEWHNQKPSDDLEKRRTFAYTCLQALWTDAHYMLDTICDTARGAI